MHAGSATANATTGRYAIFGEIASGGMATIQYGRAVGAGGFSRAVAIKRLHPQFAKDPAFVSMFLDEARLSSRIAHANVVPTLDVLSGPDELAVVMEYVHGEALSRLMQIAADRGEAIPARLAVTLIVGVLHGLHAAHETTDDHGEPLHIVHRDVSPENVLVGSDGVPRLIDFGIARAQGRSRVTPAGELKGKLAYMAPEQYQGIEVDRRADVYGASVVLWEALTGHELFSGDSDAALVGAVMRAEIAPPSTLRPELMPALDAIVMRGLSRDREGRFASAREMALALERQIGVATQSEVSDWLEQQVGEVLARRALTLRQASMPRDYLTVDEPPSAGTRRIASTPDAALTELGPSAPTPSMRRSGMRARRPRPRIIAGLAVALVLLLLGSASLLTRESERAPTTTVPAVTAPTRTQPSPSELPSALTSAPPAQAAPTPAAPAPSVSTSPERAEDSKVESRETLPPRPRARTRSRRDKSEENAREAAPAKRVDCSSPFVVDERGIRRVKPECL